MELFRKTINFGPNQAELDLYQRLMERLEPRGFNKLVKRLLKDWLTHETKK